MNCDGAKIRRLREQYGWTQSVLAQASGLNRRTIQRAEDGDDLNIESIASLASVFKVAVRDLQREIQASKLELDKNAVVLKPTTSGKGLLDTIRSAFYGSVECLVDPVPDNVDAIVSFVREMEDLLPDPWDETDIGFKRSLADDLMKSVSITQKIADLQNKGISVFVGTYTASAQIPRYDMDEGHLYVKTNQKYEPVTVCKIRVGSASEENSVVLVDDIWSKPEELPASHPLDDDDPF